MAGIELLTAADHAAVTRVLVDSYGDYAERLGPVEWPKMRGMLEQATEHLANAELGGWRGPAGPQACVFYFVPGQGDRTIFPVEWVSMRLIGVVHAARDQGLCRQLVNWCIENARRDGARHLGLHTSEAMTKARLLYERMGFVVDGDLPATFGLRYWRYRLDL